MALPGTLVIGVGNPTAGDDAAGRLVARALARRGGNDFDVAEASGEALGLVALFEGRKRVVLVDACQSGAPAGTLHRFDAHDGALPIALGAVSSHGFGAGAAIELARVLGRLPDVVVVHAIEGATFAPETEPAPPVMASIARVVDIILGEEARQWT